MLVLSSRLIKESNLCCLNQRLLWADLGSPTASRLHGSIQQTFIERLSSAPRYQAPGRKPSCSPQWWKQTEKDHQAEWRLCGPENLSQVAITSSTRGQYNPQAGSADHQPRA